jgi:hypothetical protein
MLDDQTIPLIDDGQNHNIEVIIGDQTETDHLLKGQDLPPKGILEI